MRIATVGLVVLASTLTFAGAAVARHISGLRGVVMQGPTMPVCRADDPCEQPARGVLLQFRRSGKVVAEVKTTRTGTYSVTLSPGSYAVTAPRRRVGTGLTPRFVHVPQGQIARVDFHLDTGMQ